jgi:dihydropteroate synthase
VIDPQTIPADARLYLRPEAFVDTPVGRDGTVSRLAGGLLWFAAYELIAVAGGRRVVQAAIPVAALPALIANLPPAQADRLRQLATAIAAPRAALQLGERVVRLDQPAIVGVLDAAAPDAAATAFDMSAAGAALVELSAAGEGKGGWDGDEIAGVTPVLTALAPSGTAAIVATRQAGVIDASIAAGARVIRDPSGLLWDASTAAAVARENCPVILGAAVGEGDVLLATYDALEAAVDRAVAAGIPRGAILIDPGVTDAASVGDALTLLNGLTLFHGLGCAIAIGGSRARLIGALSNEAPADARLGGSLTLALTAADAGAQLIRSHDVAATVQALRVWRGLKDAALTSRRD